MDDTLNAIESKENMLEDKEKAVKMQCKTPVAIKDSLLSMPMQKTTQMFFGMGLKGNRLEVGKTQTGS